MNAGTPGGRDRRREPRCLARGGIRVLCRKGAHGLGPNLALALLDVSQTGARLAVGPALTPGQEVDVCLMAPGWAREQRRPGLVVWCVAAADGAHLIGVRFGSRLPPAALLDLARPVRA